MSRESLMSNSSGVLDNARLDSRCMVYDLGVWGLGFRVYDLGVSGVVFWELGLPKTLNPKS